MFFNYGYSTRYEDLDVTRRFQLKRYVLFIFFLDELKNRVQYFTEKLDGGEDLKAQHF